MNPAFSINKMSNLNKSSPPFPFKMNDSLIYDTNINSNNMNSNSNYNNMNSNSNYNNTNSNYNNENPNKKNKKGKGNNHANDNINSHMNANNHKPFSDSVDTGNNSPEKEKIASTLIVETSAEDVPVNVEDKNNINVKIEEQYTSFTTNVNETTPVTALTNTNITMNIPATSAPSSPAKNPEKDDDLWNDRYLVDPLSVIIKLSLLGKKEIHTKLSIINNAVQIHEIGLFQGIARFYYNSNKFDIYYLHTPIKYACIHYLLNKHTHEYDIESVKKLFTNAIHGLENLIVTYKSSAIVELCLNNYIDIIRNSINETYNPSLYKNDKYNVYYTSELTQNMFSLWTPDKMQIILNINEYIYTDNNKSSESIRSLETFMMGIDADIKKIVEKMGVKK